MAVNFSLLLRQFDELWCFWVFWLAGFDVGCLVIRVSFWSRQPWWRKLDIPRCVSSAIHVWLLLFSALFWVIRQHVSRFICCSNYFASFDKSRTLFCRHFLGIFSLVIWKPRDSWKYFQEIVIAIASIAFSNGATNCNYNFLSYLFFYYCVCMIIVFFPYFSLAHVCHVVGSSEYAGTMWPFNGTFSQWFYILFRFKFNYVESDLKSTMECNSAFCWEIP